MPLSFILISSMTRFFIFSTVKRVSRALEESMWDAYLSEFGQLAVTWPSRWFLIHLRTYLFLEHTDCLSWALWWASTKSYALLFLLFVLDSGWKFSSFDLEKLQSKRIDLFNQDLDWMSRITFHGSSCHLLNIEAWIVEHFKPFHNWKFEPSLLPLLSLLVAGCCNAGFGAWSTSHILALWRSLDCDRSNLAW